MHKNSHKYFRNIDCKYYPCHALENMSCLFCYCPLYPFNCRGNFTVAENGIKDCSKCLIPHSEKGYDYVIRFLKKEE